MPIGWSVEPHSFAAANAQLLRAAGQRPIRDLMGPERHTVDAYARQAVAWALAATRRARSSCGTSPTTGSSGTWVRRPRPPFIAPAVGESGPPPPTPGSSARRSCRPPTSTIAATSRPFTRGCQTQSGVGLHVFVYSKRPIAFWRILRGARKHGKFGSFCSATFTAPTSRLCQPGLPQAGEASEPKR